IIDEKSYKIKVGHIGTFIFDSFKHLIYDDLVKEQYIKEYNSSYPNNKNLQLLINFDKEENQFIQFLENSKFSERKHNSLLSIYFFSKKQYEKVEDITLKYINSDDIIFRNHSRTMFILSLINQNKLSEAMKETVDAYFIDKNTIAILPIADITDAIINNIEKTLSWPNEIDAPILFYLCTISRNLDTEGQTEFLYEYYLKSHGYKRPTELINNYLINNITFDNKIIFYLDKICIPDIMKTSEFMNDYFDAEKERIQICHYLITINNNNEKKYLQEIKDREQNLFIKKQSTRIEKNKIYVDIEGIKKSYLKELHDDYIRLTSLLEVNGYEKDLEVEKIINVLKNNIPTEVENVTYEETINSMYISNISSNEIDDVFKKIIELARDIFVKNEHYGLDVYLSTKIRHGTISNHLRKPL
ncbi:hypothetical protein, partial [Aliarcobacter skirrowii]|uniref:hypothetical protein n=1 Tax=Aliarcobacter skirrowii TaxID=28200 RepID=UPI0029BD21C9